MLFNRYVALALSLIVGASFAAGAPTLNDNGMEYQARDVIGGYASDVKARSQPPPPYTPPRPPPYTPNPNPRPLTPIPEERKHRGGKRELIEGIVHDILARSQPPPPYTPPRPPPYTPNPNPRPLTPIPEERKHRGGKREFAEDLVNEILARSQPPPPYTPKPPPPYTPNPNPRPLTPIPEERKHRGGKREFVEDLVNEILARSQPPPPYTPKPPPPYTPNPNPRPLTPIPEERKHRGGKREFVEEYEALF